MNDRMIVLLMMKTLMHALFAYFIYSFISHYFFNKNINPCHNSYARRARRRVDEPPARLGATSLALKQYAGICHLSSGSASPSRHCITCSDMPVPNTHLTGLRD